MALTTPTVGIQDPNLAGQLGGIGDAAISLQQANQRTAGQVAAEQDLVASQIPTAQAARREQLADMVSKAQIRRNTRALFPDNATEFQLNLAQRYQEVTGNMPPMNAQTGMVDFDKMNREMTELADKQRNLELMKITGKASTAQTDAIYAATEAANAAKDELASIEAVRGVIQDSAKASATSGKNVVGPVTGGQVGRIAMMVRAAFGDETGYNRQRLVQMFNKSQVLKRTEKMKGVLSDKDIRFLEESVPSPADTEETWIKFLETYEATMQRALGLAQTRAQGSATSSSQDLVAPAGWTPKGAGATAAPATTEEPGVFTDDELRQGTVVAPEGGGGFYIEAPDGTRKRADAAALMRILALRGSNATTPAAAARPPGMTTVSEMQSRVGDVDIMPAPGLPSNPPQFGVIAPLAPGGYDRTSFNEARGALTGTRP